jgi:hypothetical protein
LASDSLVSWCSQKDLLSSGRQLKRSEYQGLTGSEDIGLFKAESDTMAGAAVSLARARNCPRLQNATE